MGQTNFKNSKFRKKFQSIPRLPQMYVQKEGQKSILQHPELSPVKIYTLIINPHQINQYQKQINFRNKYQQQLIQILYGQFIKEQAQYMKINIYIQYISVTLQQVSNINFKDLLVIFRKIVLGFKVLFKQYGPFQPQPTMIGFNEMGEVKVWINPKFSKCFPKISYKMIDEQKMISSLGQIFMSKVNLNTLPQVKGRKFRFEAKKFQQAIILIQDQFPSKQNIPDKIISIMKLVNLHQQSQQKNQHNQSKLYLRKTDKTIKFSYGNNTISQIKNPQNQRVNINYRNNLNINNSPQKSKSVSISKTSKVKVNFTNNIPQQKIRRVNSLVKFTNK